MQAEHPVRQPGVPAREEVSVQGEITGAVPHLPHAPDPAVHHHPARATGPHPAGPRGEELPGAGQGSAGGSISTDA